MVEPYFDEIFCMPNTTTGCGNGVCNALGTSCACFEGYIFDYMQNQFPNCYLWQDMRTGILITFGVVSVGVIFASMLVLWLKKPRGIPLKLNFIALATGVIGSCYTIALWQEGRAGIVTNVFFALLVVTSGGVFPAVLLWMYTAPYFNHFKGTTFVTKKSVMRTLGGLAFFVSGFLVTTLGTSNVVIARFALSIHL
jgi:hypothetical protein